MDGIHFSGVVPWLRVDHDLHFVLITNRSGLWGFPKGLIEDGLTPWASAAKEATEEAGVVGPVEPDPVTVYRHSKWVGVQEVAMYLMRVDELLDHWDEDDLRDRIELDYHEARALLRDELVPVLDWAWDALDGMSD